MLKSSTELKQLSSLKGVVEEVAACPGTWLQFHLSGLCPVSKTKCTKQSQLGAVTDHHMKTCLGLDACDGAKSVLLSSMSV